MRVRRAMKTTVEVSNDLYRALPEVRLEQLPRMADFALWATACESAFCPVGGFLQAYKANRRAAIEDVVEADPVAARIRDIMAERTIWTGNASDLLRVAASSSSDDASRTGLAWPKSPQTRAGPLPPPQAPLRALAIDISLCPARLAVTPI